MNLPKLWRIFSALTTQVVSSLTTVVLTLAAAQVLTATDFGIFSMAFAVYAIILGIVRGITTEVVVYHRSHLDAFMLGREIENSTGATLAVGLGLGLVSVAPIALIPSIPDSLLLFAACLPFLLLQGHLRLIFNVIGRSHIGLIIDVACAGVMIAMIFGTPLAPGIIGVMIWWGVPAAIAAIVSLIVLRCIPRIPSGIRWVLGEAKLGRLYAGDFLISNALTSGATLILGIIAGAAAGGALRAAQILLTPILLVTRGALVAVAPVLARLAVHGRDRLISKVSVAYSAACFLAGVLAWLIVFFIPRPWIDWALGQTAPLALEVFPYAAIAVSIFGVAGGAGLGLRAFGEIRSSVRIKAISFPVGIIGVATGALVAGAPGSQVGLALGELVRTIGNWRQLRTVVRKRSAQDNDDHAP